MLFSIWGALTITLIVLLDVYPYKDAFTVTFEEPTALASNVMLFVVSPLIATASPSTVQVYVTPLYVVETSAEIVFIAS